MKNKTIFIFILSIVVFSNCGLLKSEEEVYSRMLITGNKLILYSDLSFKNETSSDIIRNGEAKRFSSTGVYEKTGEGIILHYEKNNIVDTLYYVYWGKRKFLVDDESIKHFAKYYNEKNTDESELMMYWTNSETKNKPLIGKPVFPKRFANNIK